MFTGTIKKRVLAKVNAMIVEKEKEFLAGKKQLADEVLKKLEAVKREHRIKERELEDKCVHDILGKIL